MTIAQDTRANFGSDYAVPATWLVWVFSVCIVGLSFKQLRADNFVGVVECVTAFIALVLLVEELRKGTLLQNRYVFGAALVFAALSLGGIWAIFAEPHRIDLRETAAYVFAFLVVVAFLTLAYRRETKVLAILAVVIALYLALVSVLAAVPNPLKPAMWYYGVRLQGFSDNPNQIALLALVALLLLAHAEMQGVLRRRTTIPLALVSAWAGSLTESAAFVATMAVAIAVLIVCTVFEEAARRSDNAKTRQKPIAFALACLLVLASFGYQFVPSVGGSAEANNAPLASPLGERRPSRQPLAVIAPSVEQFTEVVQSEAREGAIRVKLWMQALAIGSRSPLVGLGPGYHLHADTPDSPLEAHNTVLDLFLVSGLIGLLPLVVIGGLALRGGRQNGHLTIVLLMGVAIASFSLFHFVGRQPLFWIMIFAIVYCGAPHMLSRNAVLSQSPRGA